jgi:hypothetical protein
MERESKSRYHGMVYPTLTTRTIENNRYAPHHDVSLSGPCASIYHKQKRNWKTLQLRDNCNTFEASFYLRKSPISRLTFPC